MNVVDRGPRGPSWADLARRTAAFGSSESDDDAAVLAKFATYIAVLVGGGDTAAGHGAHEYWRLNITATNGGSNLNVSNVEFRSAPGGASKTVGGTPISGGDYPGYSPNNAFDANHDSPWYAPGAFGWIGYHFTAPVEVAEVLIRYGFSDGPTFAPRDFTVDFSDDGAAWTTAWSVVNSTAWTNGAERTFTDPAAL